MMAPQCGSLLILPGSESPLASTTLERPTISEVISSGEMRLRSVNTVVMLWAGPRTAKCSGSGLVLTRTAANLRELRF